MVLPLLVGVPVDGSAQISGSRLLQWAALGGAIGWLARPMPARAEPSRELGAEAAERLMRVCPSERPVIVAVKESGSLASWFDGEDFEARLRAGLPDDSMVGPRAYEYVDTGDDAAIRQMLSRVNGGLFIADVQPARQRVDVFISGHCFPERGQETAIEGLLVQREPEERAAAVPQPADPPRAVRGSEVAAEPSPVRPSPAATAPSRDPSLSARPSPSVSASDPARPSPALQLGVHSPGSSFLRGPAFRLSLRHSVAPAWCLVERVELLPDWGFADLTATLVGIAHEGSPDVAFAAPVVRPELVVGALLDRSWDVPGRGVRVSPHLRGGPAVAVLKTLYASYDESLEGVAEVPIASTAETTTTRPALLLEGGTELRGEGRVGLDLSLSTLAWFDTAPQYDPTNPPEDSQLTRLHRLGLALQVDLGGKP